jgi:hypothetical protein
MDARGTEASLTHLSLDRLHFDPTHLIFAGAYATSQPRPATPLSAFRGDAQLAPAHFCHSYAGQELHPGDLRHGEAGKKPKFNNFRTDRIEDGESSQSFVER